MENYKSFGGRVSLLWFPMGILLLLGYAKAENMAEPLKNVNLAPFWQWRSASECMLPQYNHNSTWCSPKDFLTLQGVVNVTKDQVLDYCKPHGCVDYIRGVLQCINSVKRDFKFANKATVTVLNHTITTGCTQLTDFSTLNYTSSGMKVYQNLFMSIISTVVFTTIINM